MLTCGVRLVYFFIWSVRVKGWTFGFGAILDAVSGGIGAAKAGVKGLFGGKTEEKAVMSQTTKEANTRVGEQGIGEKPAGDEEVGVKGRENKEEK